MTKILLKLNQYGIHTSVYDCAIYKYTILISYGKYSGVLLAPTLRCVGTLSREAILPFSFCLLS